MKKSILAILSILIITLSVDCVFAKTAKTNPETSAAIKLYKAGDYTQSYVKFSDIVKRDPSNALAYYYLGMSSIQIGKKSEGIDNYNKAIELSPNGILGSYAKKGIRCAEDPYTCHNTSITDSDDQPEDKFIKSPFGSGFSEQARSTFERHKIENMMREINRSDEIAPQKFKDYKDFSSQAAPTDEEIAAAIKVLQKAGLGDYIGNQSYLSDINSLAGVQQNSNTSDYAMLNLLMNGNGTSSTNLNPQIIQSLLTSQMTANF